MKKGLEHLLQEKDTFDKESQSFLASLSGVKREIDLIDSMKRTEGWKVIDKKIREELHIRIKDLVKDDLKIQTLLALLVVADTKSMSTTLQGEIEKILPE